MQPTDPVFHKPKSVIAAKNLLYASVFIALINLVIYYGTMGVKFNGWTLELILAVTGFALVIFLIRQIALRKKWARTTLLILFIIMLSSFVTVFKEGSNVGIIAKSLFVFRQALQIAGLVFLYREESNLWFNLE